MRRFALDYFNGGLPPLGHLRILPVDYSRIDDAFVRDVSDERLGMVEAINRVGRIRGMQTIAESVEHRDAPLALPQRPGVGRSGRVHAPDSPGCAGAAIGRRGRSR